MTRSALDASVIPAGVRPWTSPSTTRLLGTRIPGGALEAVPFGPRGALQPPRRIAVAVAALYGLLCGAAAVVADGRRGDGGEHGGDEGRRGPGGDVVEVG